MSLTLRSLAQQGEISALSRYFGEFIANQSNQTDHSILAYTAAIVSEANQQGDVCIDLDRYQSQVLFHMQSAGNDEVIVAPALSGWREQLLGSISVGLPGELCPLILEENRLYLYRYWYYESQIAESILGRVGTMTLADTQLLTTTLERLYPANTYIQQKLAVAIALRNRFALICGGPGTGKTTTVINILTALLEQQPDLRIALAAPTGKAAARLIESLRPRLGTGLDGRPQMQSIPDSSVTLHRLLEYSRRGARYNRRHPLPLDCIVIDEASMIDLTLMHHLLEALPFHARIILLGDRDQLASVAAGSVLADITGRGLVASYSSQQAAWLRAIAATLEADEAQSSPHYPLADSIALLTDSYRFEYDSKIGHLARLVNKGEASAVLELVSQSAPDLRWSQALSDRLPGGQLDQILDLYRSVIDSKSVEQAFAAFESFRILCAVRKGAFGVEEINRQIEKTMRSRGWVDADDQFHGRAILINSNDYETGLYNGDLGLIWSDSNDRKMACFMDSDQGIRRIAIANLPEHSPAWAMTVHKSQGSEFDSVLLILADDNQKRGLSRELLYTGITRSRRSLWILASETALKYACENTAQRLSGLTRKLGWAG